MSIFLIALGGALGAVCRYLFGGWLGQKIAFQAVPLPMLIVNWLGSFGLGLAVSLSVKHGINVPLSLTVGFFGAFTTFSTFSVEAVQLLMKNEYRRAIVYIITSLFGSVGMFAAAYHFM